MDDRVGEVMVALRSHERFSGIRERFGGEAALLLSHVDGSGFLESLAELRETPVTQANEALDPGVLSVIQYFLELDEPDRSLLLKLSFMAAAIQPHLDGQVEEMQADPVAIELHDWCRRLMSANPKHADEMRRLVSTG